MPWPMTQLFIMSVHACVWVKNLHDVATQNLYLLVTRPSSGIRTDSFYLCIFLRNEAPWHDTAALAPHGLGTHRSRKPASGGPYL